jgi:anti-sigma B factor antagonist
LADEGKRGVVVDLTDVTFMDSTGIGVLLNAVSHFEGRHAQLVVVCDSDLILRPLQLTGVINLISVVDSREKALGALA